MRCSQWLVTFTGISCLSVLLPAPCRAFREAIKPTRYQKLWRNLAPIPKKKQDAEEKNRPKIAKSSCARMKTKKPCDTTTLNLLAAKKIGTERGVSEIIETPSPDNIDVIDELNRMLELSSLVYAFAQLRKAVKAGGVRRSRFSRLTQLDNSDIIQDNFREPDHHHDGGLKRPISAEEIGKVMSPQNMELLSPHDKEIASPLNVLAIKNMQRLERKAFLWEFNDHFAGKELVYGVTVNRMQKRVTIIFRGSVCNKDWRKNIAWSLDDLEKPCEIQDVDLAGPIRVHRGFKGYLLEDPVESGRLMYGDKKATKYGQIVEDLIRVYLHEEHGERVHKGFRLFVTGHSLGGALATLLAFKLSGTAAQLQNIGIPCPITCTTFGSPCVGDINFNKAFKALEEKGRVQHVRVSNQHDVVPVFPHWRGYVHTGVNIHLKDDASGELGYDHNVKRLFSQTRPWSLDRHAMLNYWKRFKQVAKWYDEKFGICRECTRYVVSLERAVEQGDKAVNQQQRDLAVSAGKPKKLISLWRKIMRLSPARDFRRKHST